MTALLLRRFASGPRAAMWLCVAVIVALGWLVLAEMANRSSLFAALCSPDGEAAFVAALAMWLAMALAMMLPSAAPMLSTYMDIADAAREKSIAVASPLILAAGYAAVWAAFSVAAALAQVATATWTYPSAAAGALFILAGAYQFSHLKHACLSKCRHPMPYFMANWTGRPVGVLRMGVEQGVHCLGCCWALMLLSFAAGTMNLLWMALIGVVMVLEKMLPQPKPLVYGLGFGFIGAGLALAIAG